MHSEPLQCVEAALSAGHAPCVPVGCMPGPHRRLLDALSSGGAGPADVAVLVRHLLGYESVRRSDDFGIEVPSRLAGVDDELWRAAGMSCTTLTGERFWVQLQRWQPPGDETAALRGDPLRDVYLEGDSPLCRRPDPVPADPFWTAMVGYADYQSAGQRQAARSVVTAPPGATLLVSLPTGTGKSSLAFAPALLRSQAVGVSVVVVPTVVLALDQERRLDELIREGGHRPSPSGRYAYIGDMSAEEKAAIREAVRDGEQRLLFTSPEGLMTGLAPALRAAAQAGHLRYFIVDEAHIVDQWGVNFRPDFQAMVGLRRILVDQSPPDVAPVTLLMTGTLSRSAAETLYRLFAGDRPFRLVSSSAVRSEPEYFVSRWSSVDDRLAALREHLLHLPRPAVVYVSLPDQVAEIRQAMTAWGFLRHAEVSGRSTATGRRDVVNGWRMGAGTTRYDVVVATSAFGLGVDVPDVRTVIHACEPETIDRFYQEVGRGGRDGDPSVNCFLLAPGDRRIAKSLGSPKMLGLEKADGRWEAMLNTSSPTSSARLRMDLDTRPANVAIEGPTNRRWNVKLLSTLARTGVLDLIAEEQPETRGEVSLEQTDIGKYVEVSIKGQVDWSEFRAERDRILSASRDGLRALDVIQRGTDCVGNVLKRWYSFRTPWGSAEVARACRGCPTCRRAGTPSRQALLPLPPVANWATDGGAISEQMRRLMPHGRLTVLIDVEAVSSPARTVRAVLDRLILAGFIHVLDLGGELTEQDWETIQSNAGTIPIIRSVTEPDPLDPPIPTVALLSMGSRTAPKGLTEWFEGHPGRVVVAPATLSAPERSHFAWSDLHLPCVTHTRLLEDL